MSGQGACIVADPDSSSSTSVSRVDRAVPYPVCQRLRANEVVGDRCRRIQVGYPDIHARRWAKEAASCNKRNARFAGSQAGRGFWQEVVAVVVSARWRVVRSLLGLDPKLPLLWSTDLGNVGERDGCTKAMRCPALLCDAMRSGMQ